MSSSRLSCHFKLGSLFGFVLTVCLGFVDFPRHKAMRLSGLER